MTKDIRLDLGRYIQNPFDKTAEKKRRLNFNELFQSKPDSGQYPWNPSRFTTEDLTRRVRTAERTLNPRLNFVPNTPFFDDNSEVTPAYDMFGLGRFNRPEDYDFTEGRAKTPLRPQEQPDFNPQWMEAYKLSPTLNPQKMAKNPMPRLKNPDPNGFLMAMAEKRADSEVNDKPSIAQLLDRKGLIKPTEVPSEEKAGETTADDNRVDTNVSPGKTVS